MPNAAAARVDDQVKHSEAREYRFWGAVGATLASVAILGGLAALEIVSLGAATPLVVAGTVLVVGGTSAMIGSAAANVAADAGRKVSGPNEGPIVSGISSIKIGPEKHAAAHLGSYASCNRHKHGGASSLETAVDVAEDVAGGLIHDAVSLFTGGLFGGGRFNPVADVNQGIKDAHEEHDNLEQIVQGSKSVLIGSGSFHAARVGDQGTCGFTVGQGCETVIIGGETVTDGTIGDGDDPDKHITDLMGEYGGKAALLGGFLLTLPAGLITAGLETFVNYKFGEVQGALVNLIPDEETRNKVNLALAMLPIFHAVRGTGGGGSRGEEVGSTGGSEGTGQSGRGPENGGATETGEAPSSQQPVRAGRSENSGPETSGPESAPPAENPVHQIGETPGGSDGIAPPDQAGGSGAEGGTADTPGASQPADPLVYQGDSPGGLRAADESGGGRPDLSPEENFPGQQHGNNCAPQSCQQIIRQATGVNHSEAAMEQMGQDAGTYDPATGTRAGGEADILTQGGVPAHTEAQTPENIQRALDNGQGVITGHSAGRLWEGDPNYTADPNYPMDDAGHAVHTTGLVRDADGNVTHYVINDTGTGTSGRMVPADQFHQSLDNGPAVVTDAPIRTPAAVREAAPTTEGSPAAPEGTTAPRDAASRGDPAAERGDPASEEAKPGEEAKSAGDAKPADTPEAKVSGDGDPTVQTGDRPGGLRSGEGEDGTGNRGAKTPQQVSQENYKKSAEAKASLPDKSSYRTKVTASNEDADFMSGTGSKSAPLPEGFKRTPLADVRARAEDIGYDFPESKALDNGDPGSHYASHAEVQASVDASGAPTGVSENMCGSCQGFYRQDAIASEASRYNTDPTGTWEFKPDGTVLRPDGQIIGPQDTINPSGTVERADGTKLKLIPRQ